MLNNKYNLQVGQRLHWAEELAGTTKYLNTELGIGEETHHKPRQNKTKQYKNNATELLGRLGQGLRAHVSMKKI